MSIEEREDNLLGELPEPNQIERGENIGYSKEGTRYDGFSGNYPFPDRDLGPPPDIALENAIRNRPGKMGSIPRRFDVTSTFDARPVNGRDFLEIVRLVFNIEEDPVTERSTFIVPDGYIGILKGFRYFVSNIPNLAEGYLTASLIADSVNVISYNKMLLPQLVNDFIPCYEISNSLKEIGIEITHPESEIGDIEVIITVQLYGNLLLSRGIPAQYEPTNSI